jgi:sugar-specific transcriptional regulator TrmB
VTGPEAHDGPAPVLPAVLSIRPERLAHEFEELGLGPAEARVIVALLRLGSAKSADLAKAAKVPRTGIYQLIQSLSEKGLVVRVPGGGPARWTTPGRDKVIDRLHSHALAAERERVHQHGLRSSLLRELLTEALPQPEPAVLPIVRTVTCPMELREEHTRLLTAAKDEVLAFTRPPFSTHPGPPFEVIVEAVARGVSLRAMYQSAQADDADAAAFRSWARDYAAVGMRARVVDVLPVKFLVVDRAAAIVALDNQVDTGSEGMRVTVLIEHSGFASMLADVFETYWARGRPYT